MKCPAQFAGHFLLTDSLVLSELKLICNQRLLKRERENAGLRKSCRFASVETRQTLDLQPVTVTPRGLPRSCE